MTSGNKKHEAKKSKATRVFGTAPAAAVGFQTLPDVFDGGKDGNQKQNPGGAKESGRGKLFNASAGRPGANKT